MLHFLASYLTIATMLTTIPTSSAPAFRSAKPIWPTGRDKEMNLSVGFRAVVEAPPAQKVILRMTASTLYRAFVNGRFAAHGPARGPHGWYRIDEWDITDHLQQSQNIIAIEVAGYNSNSYYLIDQPAFLQAEIDVGDKILASTNSQDTAFTATILKERLQKVQRYSFQRPFSEVYFLKPDYDRWHQDLAAPFEPVPCDSVPAHNLLPRRIPYPTFDRRSPSRHVAQGTIKTGIEIKTPWKDRSLVNISGQLKGFKETELTTIPSLELQTIANDSNEPIDQELAADATLNLNEKSFHILDFGTNLTGFLGATVVCRSKTKLFLTFDEILSGKDVDFKRLGCVNIVTYDLEPGTYDIETIEPYTLRYLKPIVLSGSCELKNIYLREYVNPDVWQAHFAAHDVRLNRLFAAARETFRQNAVDIFMDCPSRERAGWLCDSFWTSRVAFDLSGNTLVEKNFLENFLLPRRFEFLPEGMLPMCYPADHNDSVFIPNWALWFVVQAEEYLARSGDRDLTDALKPRIMALLTYLRGFLNDDGLLEKLPSWVFVEWSDANKYVQDVNYPSNMLYAAALAATGRMYGDPELLAQAYKVREVIRKQSFDGHFFVDNAVRKNGKLQVTGNRTEVCQYYAFFFDTAGPETHGELWKTLREEFGPKRRQTKAYPEIGHTNQFPGNVLRLELLSRQGLCRQLLEESVDYNLFMADRTGTLWENDGDYASCNHGFASHVAHVLYRDVLGIHRVDTVRRAVELRFPDVTLEWCEGRIPTVDGPVSLRWWKDGDSLIYRADVPAGYGIQVKNLSGKQLLRR